MYIYTYIYIYIYKYTVVITLFTHTDHSPQKKRAEVLLLRRSLEDANGAKTLVFLSKKMMSREYRKNLRFRNVIFICIN